MIFLYNLSFLVFAVFYFPIFLVKLRQAAEPRKLLAERSGFYKKPKNTGKIVWLHTVSVGEVMAVRRFISLFLEKYPGWTIVLTTVTPTGQKIAAALAAETDSSRVLPHYFPFDLSWAQRAFLKAFSPSLILLAETEIWPNLLVEASRARIPVGVINARLSPRSASRYLRFRFIFRGLFDKLDFVLAQSEEDAARFRMLGIEDAKVKVLGNLKFDNLAGREDDDGDASWKGRWGIKSGDLVWIAGSTHPGEEEKILKVFSAARRKFPQLRLILAPRHIERSGQILDFFNSHSGLQTVLASGRKADTYDILILDQLGILRRLYQLADVVFMGGSLVPHGGQNPIEPASFKKAVLYGPHVFNFQKVYETLAQEEGAIQVAGEEALQMSLEDLLRNAQERHRIGQNAFASVHRLQGASRRHLEWLARFLSPEERNKGVFHERLFPQTGGRV